MTNEQQQLEALQEMRTMMKRSSRFLSLSGLSGIAAGTFALIGAAVAYLYLGSVQTSEFDYASRNTGKWGLDFVSFFLLDAGMVLFLALASGIFFTTRKARKENQPIWDHNSRQMLLNFFIPLVTGGLFCLIQVQQGNYELIAATTLLFYGMACVNAGKYTHRDIYYLGLCEIALGLVSALLHEHSLMLWAIGFGVLHILYGISMYVKYER